MSRERRVRAMVSWAHTWADDLERTVKAGVPDPSMELADR